MSGSPEPDLMLFSSERERPKTPTRTPGESSFQRRQRERREEEEKKKLEDEKNAMEERKKEIAELLRPPSEDYGIMSADSDGNQGEEAGEDSTEVEKMPPTDNDEVNEEKREMEARRLKILEALANRGTLVKPEPTEAVDEEEVLETGDQQEKNEEEEAEEAGDNPPMEMEDQIIEESEMKEKEEKEEVPESREDGDEKEETEDAETGEIPPEDPITESMPKDTVEEEVEDEKMEEMMEEEDEAENSPDGKEDPIIESANGDEDDSEKGDEEEKNGGASPEKVEDNDDSGEEIETPQPLSSNGSDDSAMEEEEPEEEGSENGEETKAESSEKYDGEEEAEEIPDKEKSEKAENDQVPSVRQRRLNKLLEIDMAFAPVPSDSSSSKRSLRNRGAKATPAAAPPAKRARVVTPPKAKKALVAKRGCTEMGYDDAEDGASDDNWRNDLKVITFPAAVAPPLPKKGRGSNVKACPVKKEHVQKLPKESPVGSRRSSRVKL
ncbi:hypothetical protein PRIPAC_96843 [Pristionchus pacificus]|uniref:Uncharacterized protein n=1 Tax=Pristionchus pacificus TaxID=54126 RepID=A0A2A6BDA9_PRIPA|nr:hypothetical protein PRIPAC_96843 [Pristionchus pacificus]|eukprot:PDM63867.1 hypothetical protein PRIPAC_49840 [Pristionchus pacificus]